MHATFEAQIEQGWHALAAGELQGTHLVLEQVLLDPDLPHDEFRFSCALQLLEGLAKKLEREDFSQLVHEAIATPNDTGALRSLGHVCLQESLVGAAACVLARATQLGADDVEVLAPLVSALEDQGRHADACAYLDAAPDLVAAHYELRCQLGINALCCGKIDDATRIGSELDAPSDAQQAALAERLSTMLERVQAVRSVSSLGPDDLRAWHFVTTGGILLHLSPFDPPTMRGRYAMTQDSAVRCRCGLVRLHAVLDEWDLLPERVLLLPDPVSRALGLAAAAVFGVEPQPYEADQPGLVVAYDIDTLHPSTPPEVAEHRPGQILFAHASCWTSPPVCAPDLTTYLYEYNVALGDDLNEDRLNENLGAAPDAAPPPPAALVPDDATVEQTVQAILDAVLGQDSEERADDGVEQLAAFAAAVAPLAIATRQEGARPPVPAGGPVASARMQ